MCNWSQSGEKHERNLAKLARVQSCFQSLVNPINQSNLTLIDLAKERAICQGSYYCDLIGLKSMLTLPIDRVVSFHWSFFCFLPTFLDLNMGQSVCYLMKNYLPTTQSELNLNESPILDSILTK